MPTPPFDDVSLAAPVMPAAPRSWIPTTNPASRISRHASMRRFSSNGIAHLHARTLVVVAVLAEAGRREHAGAADPVAPGRGAEQHRQVARRPTLAPARGAPWGGGRGRTR